MATSTKEETLPVRSTDEWTEVRFDEVVCNIKDSVDRDTTTLERFVAGEHMGSDDIHLRSFGELGEDYLGPAFHRRFTVGQILYGSRRTYLKKVCVAAFEGICANTTFVLEANDRLCQELLPFIMLSQSFTEHSVRESKGSVNPYINWKDIAKFTFRLPPPKEQTRISKLLYAADQAANALNPVLRQMEIARSAFVEDVLSSFPDNASTPILKLLSGSPESGHSTPPSPDDTGFYVLSLSAVSNRGYRRGQLKPIKKSDKANNALLRHGDLLISRSNTVELVGLTGIFDERRDDVCYPDTMMRLPVNEELISAEFLELVLLSRRGRRHMRRVAAGTSGSMKKINRQTLGEFKVPCPSLSDQSEILERAQPFRDMMLAVEAKQQLLVNLRRDLTEKLLAEAFQS